MTAPDGAVPITDSHEDLLRQVHPTQLRVDGVPDSSAFNPSPRDSGLLSTRRHRIGAERAYREWVDDGHDSVGTWGIRQDDFPEELEAYDDSAIPGHPEGHASIDFGAFGTTQRKKVARLLRDASNGRGALHRPLAEKPVTEA